MTQSDNYKKIGCFNMQCPGFVQTHKGIYLGTGVDNTSIHPSMVERLLRLMFLLPRLCSCHNKFTIRNLELYTTHKRLILF